MNQICVHIARLEGKKVETPIGNIREIMGIVSDLVYDYPEVVEVLYTNGARRKSER